MSVSHAAEPLPRKRPSLAHRLTGWSQPVPGALLGLALAPGVGEARAPRPAVGRSYTTPVAARRTADGFMIPMAFGEHADWTRNVLASGQCVLHWKGRRYEAHSPELVDTATAAPAFNRIQRVLMRPTRIDRFLRVRTTD